MQRPASKHTNGNTSGIQMNKARDEGVARAQEIKPQFPQREITHLGFVRESKPKIQRNQSQRRSENGLE